LKQRQAVIFNPSFTLIVSSSFIEKEIKPKQDFHEVQHSSFLNDIVQPELCVELLSNLTKMIDHFTEEQGESAKVILIKVSRTTSRMFILPLLGTSII
jgi:hypothetical protein